MNPTDPNSPRIPQRIQLRRTKGWRKPDGAVVVARPTRWGNPWRIGSTGWTVDADDRINREPHPPLTAEQAVEAFRNACSWEPSGWPDIIRRELAGKDLACWCPIGEPCHADVLLELANGDPR
jgi:Domain of unknown function (DUF4326)